jgi:hypothetical protein
MAEKLFEIEPERLQKYMDRLSNHLDSTGILNRVSAEVRKESYEKSKSEFSKQEKEVLHEIRCGRSDAWSISGHIPMLITSVRRALNSLAKKKAIEVTEKVWNIGTGRFVSKYKITNADNKNS